MSNDTELRNNNKVSFIGENTLNSTQAVSIYTTLRRRMRYNTYTKDEAFKKLFSI